jgi:SnoaL-like protein
MQTPLGVVAALARATNAHDIEAFVALFSEEYDSEQPAHPDRKFRGRDQVRANWSAVFSGLGRTFATPSTRMSTVTVELAREHPVSSRRRG